MAEAQTPAERSRVYRQRRRQGAVVVSLEVQPYHADTLAEHGFLDPDQAGSRTKVGEAIDMLLFAMIEGDVKVDWSRYE